MQGFEYEPLQRPFGREVGPDFTEQYEAIMEAHREHWQRMTAAAALIDLPVVTTGWDVSPRSARDVPWPFPVAPSSGRHEYPYVPVVAGSTPERFEELLRDAAEHIESVHRVPSPCSSTPGMSGPRVVICCPNSKPVPPNWRPSNESSAQQTVDDSPSVRDHTGKCEYEGAYTKAMGMNMSTELVTDLTSLLCQLQLRFSWRPNLRDEGDNKFIEAAIHAAAVVVTYNVSDHQRTYGRQP